jgi:hypothetical protein
MSLAVLQGKFWLEGKLCRRGKRSARLRPMDTARANSPPCRQHSFARQLGLEGSFQLCEVLRRDGLERGPQRCHDAADRLFSLLLSGLHGLLDSLLVAAAGDRPERLPKELGRILQRAGALAQDLPEGGADGADIGLIAHTLDGIAHLGGAPRPRRRDPAGPQRVVGQAEGVVVPPCHLHEPPEPQDATRLGRLLRMGRAVRVCRGAGRSSPQ